ncbi:MAG: TetR family transcriptional regulator, partial [Pseudomonadota bacterium]|nr:TetR family transcriptional regulator [Pseudomonadota bacterium]
MARSTKTEAVETRRRILDAAEQIFHVLGVPRTSLGDIATAAQVSRGAIYWHFANKAELFNAMYERVRLPMEAMVEDAEAEQDAQRGQANNGTLKADPLGQLRSAC